MNDFELTRRGFLSLGAVAGLLAALPSSVFTGLSLTEEIVAETLVELPKGFIVEEINLITEPVPVGVGLDGWKGRVAGAKHIEVFGNFPSVMYGLVQTYMNGKVQKDWVFELPQRDFRISGDFIIQEIRELFGVEKISSVKLTSVGPVLVHIDNQEMII